MDERPDPLEAPPARALVQVHAPECPVHGKMTYRGNDSCPMVQFGAVLTCACEPERFECLGFDGEGCEVTPPVGYAGWLAGSR